MRVGKSGKRERVLVAAVGRRGEAFVTLEKRNEKRDKTYKGGEYPLSDFPPPEEGEISSFDEPVLEYTKNGLDLAFLGSSAEEGDGNVGRGVGPSSRSDEVKRRIQPNELRGRGRLRDYSRVVSVAEQVLDGGDPSDGSVADVESHVGDEGSIQVVKQLCILYKEGVGDFRADISVVFYTTEGK